MDWIQTWSGGRFHPFAPDPAEVRVADIAHALSLLCRFNGHCRAFYSVAEHAVRVSRAVPPEHALAALLHDAAEAYVSDVPRPVRRRVPDFDAVEARILAVILERFGLPPRLPDAVRAADDALLATELRDLMAPPPEPWALRAEPLPGRIEPWSPAEAERAFLARFAELAGTPG